MQTYHAVTPLIIEQLQSLVSEKNVFIDKERLEVYSHDEVTDQRYHHLPEVVVLPETTEQIAEIIKLANEELIPVVPRGAGTGLACGAVPI